MARTRVRTARARLLLAYVLLLSLSLVASVVLVRGVLVDSVEERVERGLQQEAEELSRLVGGSDPETGEPFGDDVAAVFDTFFRRNVPDSNEALFGFVDGAPYLASAEAPARLDQDADLLAAVRGLDAPRRGSLESAAGRTEYLAVPVQSASGEVLGVFVVAQFAQAALERVEDNVTRIALLLLTVLAAASLLAFALAGRVLAPLREVADTARAIQEDDLIRRIAVRGHDEVAELGHVFNAMLDRIERSLQGQRELLSDVGHELRTPITIVRGHLELMTDDPQDREETLALVDDELERMARLVDDLLLLARAERPDFLDRRPVEVQPLLADAVSKASALGDRDWRLAADLPGVASEADPQRLTQALVQLASNAVRHTAPGGLVELGGALEGAWLRLWVRDDGEGIAPADQARVFERFVRAGTTRRGEGSGLGLSIVRAGAEAHGGSAELTSTPGRGTRVSLVLPCPARATRRGRRRRRRWCRRSPARPGSAAGGRRTPGPACRG